jgi:hypothetical protein
VSRPTDAVWQYLSTKTDLISLLGQDSDGAPWFFQDDLIMTEQYLENSGKCAVVVAVEGEYSTPEPFSHVQYPRITFDVWADPDRNPDGSPVSTNSSRDKLQDITEVLMTHMHRIGGFDERWGDLRVLGSQRLILLRYRTKGMEFQGVTDGNGLAQSTIYFGLTTS